jgi:hypothetical protein
MPLSVSDRAVWLLYGCSRLGGDDEYNFQQLFTLLLTLQIRFDTVSALDAWLSDPSPHIQVKKAKHWSACNASEIEKSNAKVLDYDWCSLNSMRSSPISQCAVVIYQSCKNNVSCCMGANT